jgi:hypothetical protein
MRLKLGVIVDGQLMEGDNYVSEETQHAYENPSFCLFLREPGKRAASGSIFVFTIPPQSFEWKRAAKVSAVQTRGSYVVSQSGSEHPEMTLRGHFGWRLRTVALTPGIVLPGFITTRRYDQHLSDLWPHIPFNAESGTESTIEQLFTGDLKMRGAGQTLDGFQSWNALRDLILYYFEQNQIRIGSGRKPLEMIYLDTLHQLRWCVVPKAHPSLSRTVQTQGTMPYELTLIGVYDDGRPRVTKGSQLWT